MFRRIPPLRDITLFAEASCVLLMARLMVRYRHVSYLQRVLARSRLSTAATMPESGQVVDDVRTALRRARHYSVGRVTCLQTAATCSYLLTRRGLPAWLIIGVHTPPFTAHAWTEVDGVVIDDDASVVDKYTVMTRL